MIKVDEKDEIRRGYYLEGKSARQIAREQHYSRETVRKALANGEEERYRLKKPRPSPVLGQWRARIGELLKEGEALPKKHRYTAHKIYELLEAEGYTGSESSIRTALWLRRKNRPMATYLPLEFDPGANAQVDWGEAEVEISGVRLTAQVFTMRLCYSRKLFARAYPTQKQECFLEGHVEGYTYFEGVVRQAIYDNLTTAVQEILEGRKRAEQRAFVALRSHYVFGSRFCTPGQGHEKGGVESDVGYVRRNLMTPLICARDWEELNRQLLARCRAEDARTVSGQTQTVGQMWLEEKAHLQPLPARPFVACVTREATVTPYSQVIYETNRYSVPADQARKHVTVRAYPFQIEIVSDNVMLTCHARSYGRNQDILNPLHYLPLLEQRPGAFEHAKPMREWRKQWPADYERLLKRLQACAERDAGDAYEAIKTFVRILSLHRDYPIEYVEDAIHDALEMSDGCAIRGHGGLNYDSILLRVRQLSCPERAPLPMDLAQHPHLQQVGTQPIDLKRYEHLLTAPNVPQQLRSTFVPSSLEDA